LFVSKEVEEFIRKLHVEQMAGKPSAVLEHYCNEEWHKQPQSPTNQRSGLVYEGGMQSPPYKNKVNAFWQLYPVFKQLVEQGNEIHLMPGNIDATTTYANIGAYCYEPQTYTKLMQSLRSKKYGLCVFNNPKFDQKQVNITRTNKEQEYLACGLPIIVYGAPATAEYVKKNDIGLTFDKLEDITPGILESEYSRVKANVDKLMPTLTMEKHIHKLEALIDEVLKGTI